MSREGFDWAPAAPAEITSKATIPILRSDSGTLAVNSNSKFLQGAGGSRAPQSEVYL
jgi:hypothetical protein